MAGISSTPIENSVQFLRLRDKYKSDIFEDSRLNKAAGLAAKKEILLNASAPDTWKEPRVKAVNRELQQWVKKIRQPGGTRAITRDEEDTDEEDNLAVAPIHRLMGDISKIRQGIKRQVPPVKQPLQTPVIKKQSTGKKPKVSGKTSSKAKKIKYSPKTHHFTSPPSSVFVSADEGAVGYSPALGADEVFTSGKSASPLSPVEGSLKKLQASGKFTGKKKSPQASASPTLPVEKKKTPLALKRLKPATGWKPYGTPVKRKLLGKDW